MGRNLIALVNIKIAGKWVFTPLILIIIGFDTHPYEGIRSIYPVTYGSSMDNLWIIYG